MEIEIKENVSEEDQFSGKNRLGKMVHRKYK
jgi:hypothetical protein